MLICFHSLWFPNGVTCVQSLYNSTLLLIDKNQINLIIRVNISVKDYKSLFKFYAE